MGLSNWSTKAVVLLCIGVILQLVPAAYAQDNLLQVRGLVRSSERVEIRSDLSAVVSKVYFKEGMSFKKGDTLISFDCSRHRAEWKSARAAAAGAAIELRTKKQLRSNGAAGTNEVRLAQSQVNKTFADSGAAKARMKYCSIKAAFSGRVVSLNVSRNEMPGRDEPLMTILDDSVLELELVLPSKTMRWIKAGWKFTFTVDETGRAYPAVISRLGAEVDAVSQTIRVFGAFDGEFDGVLAGMSGNAVFRSEGS